MKSSKRSQKQKVILASLHLLIIVGFIILWFSVDNIQTAPNLWVLFFYCIPSEFLIGLLPHEPILLYYGKFFSPFVVAGVSVLGTILAEGLNYSAFSIFKDIKTVKNVSNNKLVNKCIQLFSRHPFIAIWVAGFSPIPFYPIRFLVVLARYPVLKYLLAVCLSRGPRFYILSMVGFIFQLPDWLIIVIFVAFMSAIVVNLLKRLLFSGKTAI